MPRRSELNGVASDIVRSFVSRNNDVRGYWALGKLYVYAKEHNDNLLPIPVIPLEQELSNETVAFVARNCGTKLLAMIENRKLPKSWLTSACITVHFESTTAKPQFFSTRTNGRPFQCRIELNDDLGRKHVASVDGWCSPHDSNIETRSARANDL
jgi:hypothetical protein